jgi:hypothetical protein
MTLGVSEKKNSKCPMGELEFISGRRGASGEEM